MATLPTPEAIRKLQRALDQRAKNDPRVRADALYDKVYRPDILAHADALAKANGGAPGPDGRTFEEIEADGWERLLEELRNELQTKTYRPGPVRRVYIPKLNGGERPLGIPNIRDRVVQTAVKLLLEPPSKSVLRRTRPASARSAPPTRRSMRSGRRSTMGCMGSSMPRSPPISTRFRRTGG